MTFFEHMRCYFSIFIIFGLWSTWNNNSAHKQYLRTCSITSFLFVFGSFALAIIRDKFYKFSKLSDVVSNCLLVLIYLTHFVIVFESIIRKKYQLKLIEQIIWVDNLLYTNLGINISYQKEKYEIFIRMLILISPDVFVKCAILGAVLFLDITYLHFFFTIYSNLVIQLKLFQMLFFVYVLKSRLNIINKELIVMRMNDISNLDAESENNTGLEYQATDNPWIFNRILSLKLVFTQLSNICDQIQCIFGWSLLIIVIQIFTLSTFQCYWAFVQLSNTVGMISDLIFIVPILLTLGALAFHCDSCTQQVCNAKMIFTFHLYVNILN